MSSTPPIPPRRSSPRARIAAWRRRVVIGSLSLFAAAWLAVAALGRQASSPASTGSSVSSSATTQGSDPQGSGTQQGSDPYGDYGDYGSGSGESGQSSAPQAQSDLPAPSTSQS